MKRIVKINRHTAEPISSLTKDEFLREAEIRVMAWDGAELRKRELFAENGKTDIIETESYLYLSVGDKKKQLPF